MKQTTFKKWLWVLLTFLSLSATAQEETPSKETPSDSPKGEDAIRMASPRPWEGQGEGPRWGGAVLVHPSWMTAMDHRVKKWLKEKESFAIGLELNHVALPTDNDVFASDYGYPTLTAGLRYTFNERVRMHRSPDPEWGLAEEVDYDSRLGNTLSAYATFARPFSRTRHWETDYSLSVGLGYSHLKYNPRNDIDNELIGSHLLIYFGAGLHLTYHPVPEWGIRAGLEFVHHSNGALNRPNKGSNAVGPSLALVYTPYYEAVACAPRLSQPFEKYWFLNFSVGAGAKTLLEDWNLTQYKTPPGDPDYRTDQFKLYAAYSLQADIMRRYARRWASGCGLDLYYATYYKRSREIDHDPRKRYFGERYSPVSVGFALKHNVYYHNWSANMALGLYLYRRMGYDMESNETPYYERIGVHYHFPSLGGLSVGANVHAHLGKANFTELAVSYPIRL